MVTESVVMISYKIKFIDSARVWQLHYQILLIISQKKFTKLNVKLVIIFLNMKIAQDSVIKYKYSSFNKNYSNKIDEELKKAIQERKAI